MRYIIFLNLVLFLVACNVTQDTVTTETAVSPTLKVFKQTVVQTNKALYNAIEAAEPGEEIVLANGVWKDVAINFMANGTEDAPIIIKAETEGKVSIEGQSYLKFGGDYLTVSGLHFKNGYSPESSIISFRPDNKSVANHCRVTNCVIEDFNQPNRDKVDLWVEFWGRHNQLDHSYLAGKTNKGPTVRVSIKGNESINNYHQIVNNHFGPRPRKGGPSAETIQIGNSGTSMSPCYTTVADNLFEKCNGEVEVISSKTNFNQFRNNVFYKCEGSLVTRHGNYCNIDANYFIGDENSNVGGIRLINTGHWVTNNYFYNLKGESFRSPLAVMNGIPKSPLNRYNQVTDVVVAHNTWVNCKSPLQFGVGTNISQKDVLPKSEIRSAVPIRTTVANNLIYNEVGDDQPIIAHDKIDKIKFKNNIIVNQNVSFDAQDGLKTAAMKTTEVSENIFFPSVNSGNANIYEGFEFDKIDKDIFGNSRVENNAVGAMVSSTGAPSNILNKKQYGATWFSNVQAEIVPETHVVTDKAGALDSTIEMAKSGDIIELVTGDYQLNSSLIINKSITIQSKGKQGTIKYIGEKETPLFSLQPNGDLTLKNLDLEGENTQYAFATLKENMSNHYNLTIEDVSISDFGYVLKAYKESFADAIVFKNTTIKDCQNGIELSEETNDKGDYNAEFITIDNCQFENVKSNVIDYYRGGYDESTIGGNLSISNSSFTNCGEEEENNILLNTRGIINVDISKNTFTNNNVKLVALLWGAKNNTHSGNTITNSGKILVEENLKLKLMY